MDHVLKKEFGLSRKMKITFTVCMLVFLCLSVFVYFKIYTDIIKVVRNQAVNSITNISELNVDSISRAITNRQLLLGTISSKLRDQEIRDMDVLLENLESDMASYEFYRMKSITGL